MPQVDKVCIIDNSPKPLPSNNLPDTVFYRHCLQNVGIAKAQNMGLDFALKNNFEYAILFDQDSMIENDFINGLLSAMTAFTVNTESNKKIAAVGPTIQCAFSNKLIPPSKRVILSEQSDYLIVKQIIASGMMISLNSLTVVGKKDEQLFIDGVDHEWCWRARKLEFLIGQSKTVVMRHRLGDARGEIFGVIYKIGSPVRLYYQTRNLILLVRRNYVPLYWKLRNLSLFFPKVLINTLILSDKKQRARFIIQGLFDGIKTRSGSVEDNWK
jgi:rhamnosyltransferase